MNNHLIEFISTPLTVEKLDSVFFKTVMRFFVHHKNKSAMQKLELGATFYTIDFLSALATFNHTGDEYHFRDQVEELIIKLVGKKSYIPPEPSYIPYWNPYLEHYDVVRYTGNAHNLFKKKDLLVTTVDRNSNNKPVIGVTDKDGNYLIDEIHQFKLTGYIEHVYDHVFPVDYDFMINGHKYAVRKSARKYP